MNVLPRVMAFALASFVFAGAAGVWMRMASLGVALPANAAWENLRHAHSHTMFFSWVTPGLMAVIAFKMRRAGAAMRQIDHVILAAILLGVISFVPFMLSGYQSSNVFGKRIPLSVIFSTVSMFTWYAFAWRYFRERRVLSGAARATLNLAVTALVLSTIGAWTRGAFVGMRETDRFLTDGAIHAFVTTFSLGWLFIAAIGLLHQRFKTPSDRRLTWANLAIAFGLCGTWVLSIAQPFVPELWWSFGSVCTMFFGLGAFTHVGVLWRHRAARGVLVPAAVISLIQAHAGVPGIMRWADEAHLRIPYLHTVFLLIVSVVIIQEVALWVDKRDLKRAQKWSFGFSISAWVLVVGLWPTTTLWPSFLRSGFDPWIVAVSAVFPVLAVVIFPFIAPSFGARIHKGGSCQR